MAAPKGPFVPRARGISKPHLSKMLDNQRRAIVVVDLAFGDCGKGTIVDFLSRQLGAHTLVRFNGGPQAGHNVVTRDGRHHTFSQFASGMFVPGVRTLLSRFMLIEPYALINEAAHLISLGISDAMHRLMIDARCPVITPVHQVANRFREIERGQAAHGTCGLGVGEAVSDLLESPHLMLSAGELADRPAVTTKLQALRDVNLNELRQLVARLPAHPYVRRGLETLLDPSWIPVAVDKYAELARRASILDAPSVEAVLNAGGSLIFEGAQGVLLDESVGFHPHTTWSRTTFANADALLDDAQFHGLRTRIGVLRTYFTRHGPGPFVTEDPSLGSRLPEPHNHDSGWQGRFRAGLFDLVAAQYALRAAGGADSLAITHLDRLKDLPPRICNAYRHDASIDPSESNAPPDVLSIENGVITNLCPSSLGALAPSSQLTRALERCQPIYSPAPALDPAGFIQLIGRELRTPVGITSFGPTAEDKRLNIPLESLC